MLTISASGIFSAKKYNVSSLGRVWLVRTRTGFTRTARLVGTAPVLVRPEHVLLAPASRPEQTEQFHFFTVKPGGNIDFGPK